MGDGFSSHVDGHKIYVDQLKHGQVEKIEEMFTPDFLEIKEKDLAFEDPVFVKGEAYIAEQDLILHLDISTQGRLPCSICNEPVKVDVELKGFYHTVPLGEIKGGVFSMLDTLREAIVLETPTFAECHQGKCPQRKDLEKYFKKESPSKDQGDDTYHPFEGLKLD